MFQSDSVSRCVFFLGEWFAHGFLSLGESVMAAVLLLMAGMGQVQMVDRNEGLSES